ncbi:MAG: Hsp70 family protein [Pirellulales bacterium]
MRLKYVLGIDLGTTHCVLAYAPLEEVAPRLQLLPVPQIVDRHAVESRDELPSYVYLAGTSETDPPSNSPVTGDSSVTGSLDLPWTADRTFSVGHFARDQASQAPQQSVSAAKSWLCYRRADPRKPILPWNAPQAVSKISPLTAIQHYLEHLGAAWQAAFPDAPLDAQQVVLTVPASFDTVARELTREAALAAGLPDDLILLEEPQAALYCWLADLGDLWRESLSLGDRLLVCDVGGGTTDLTLISVCEQDGELVLERDAVGNHLLVGGDNMDLALAHRVAGLFAEQGVKLNPWQSVALWHACREAKETLLADEGPETHSISVLGRGSKLIGGTVSVQVDRQLVARWLVDGFFPACTVDDRPKKAPRSGFQEIGLPFESDSAVTRHVAAFLRDQSASGHPAGSEERAEVSPSEEPFACPTHLLLNGGVFKAGAMRERLLEVLGGWGDQPLQMLTGSPDLDHAVARGAAYYAWTKTNRGIRIRGGVARSYYLGIESAGLAIPGMARPLRALCVVPFGMEEGTSLDVPADPLGLAHGEQAEFRFFSSAVRQDDRPGDWLDHWNEGELVETAPLVATLPAAQQIEEPYVPVRFQTRITELGQFELWCLSTQTDEQWKLEFDVREEWRE